MNQESGGHFESRRNVEAHVEAYRSWDSGWRKHLMMEHVMAPSFLMYILYCEKVNRKGFGAINMSEQEHDQV